MRTFNREGAIQALIRSDLDRILNHGDTDYLSYMLETGFRGYRHELDAVLYQECKGQDIPEAEYLTGTED